MLIERAKRENGAIAQNCCAN